MNSPGLAKKNFDVIIVGNGVLGLSLGLVLARRGQDVAVLGESHRPFAGTTASGAMLGTFGEVTTTLVGSDAGRHKLELGIKATGMWPEWLDGLGDGAADEILTADGTTVILNAIGMAEIDDTNFRAIRDELIRYDAPFEDVDPLDLEWVEAEPLSRPLRALHIPGEHAVDSAALMVRLQDAFVAAGGVLVEAEATKVDHTGDRVTGVTLTDGDHLTGGQVALAAGARTQALLDRLPVGGHIPPLVSGYGVSVLMKTFDGTAPRSVIRTPNRSFACGLHLVPRGEGQVYIGATNVISTQPRDLADMRDMVFLMQCAHRQIRMNLWASPVQKVQVGNRPVSVDGFPLLGSGGMAGLWIMTGTYRDGLHMSPLVAREMTARILGEPTAEDFELFTPLRRPIQASSREQIVTTTFFEQFAIGPEQDWTLPVDWHYWIGMDLRPAIERWVEEIDPEITPPAELVFSSRLDPDLLKLLREYYARTRRVW
ncbi:glycine/D-amino acid oxidase-like deaminating enzyme [Saccharothrix ecbatanensis]|uniref:Glycine/D-amino acid oxidase-like deaminating enzyme n=1 Tax=Saccharothrix ecbatanensis TaxID=1105145 RepID=A0A7W9HKQ7_9PSEU|nr:FAD-dependent oxidoreductase [Saccharothrix ecbatanensis]MBB5804077.1 glycine/D-amino acid oxidase-like deaminating enzyme [Saccharothrix ecbatanensis]